MRKWLNNVFLKDSFTEREKGQIVETFLKNPNNLRYGIKGGNDTKDKIFLLSIDEVEKYFSSDEERSTIYIGGAPAWWWLRSPGKYDDNAAIVSNNGDVNKYGHNVGYGIVAVRPALWVNLDSGLF